MQMAKNNQDTWWRTVQRFALLGMKTVETDRMLSLE